MDFNYYETIVKTTFQLNNSLSWITNSAPETKDVNWVPTLLLSTVETLLLRTPFIHQARMSSWPLVTDRNPHPCSFFHIKWTENTDKWIPPAPGSTTVLISVLNFAEWGCGGWWRQPVFAVVTDKSQRQIPCQSVISKCPAVCMETNNIQIIAKTYIDHIGTTRQT